jgi:hypothetical protein
METNNSDKFTVPSSGIWTWADYSTLQMNMNATKWSNASCNITMFASNDGLYGNNYVKVFDSTTYRLSNLKGIDMGFGLLSNNGLYDATRSNCLLNTQLAIMSNMALVTASNIVVGSNLSFPTNAGVKGRLRFTSASNNELPMLSMSSNDISMKNPLGITVFKVDSMGGVTNRGANVLYNSLQMVNEGNSRINPVLPTRASITMMTTGQLSVQSDDPNGTSASPIAALSINNNFTVYEHGKVVMGKLTIEPDGSILQNGKVILNRQGKIVAQVTEYEENVSMNVAQPPKPKPTVGSEVKMFFNSVFNS